jgi:hypothetical protein
MNLATIAKTVFLTTLTFTAQAFAFDKEGAKFFQATASFTAAEVFSQSTSIEGPRFYGLRPSLERTERRYDYVSKEGTLSIHESASYSFLAAAEEHFGSNMFLSLGFGLGFEPVRGRYADSDTDRNDKKNIAFGKSRVGFGQNFIVSEKEEIGIFYRAGIEIRRNASDGRRVYLANGAVPVKRVEPGVFFTVGFGK